jgi:hypothetical protein
MHAAELPRPFHRHGWVYEEKYDGWRMVAEKFVSQVISDPVSLDTGLTTITVTKEVGHGSKSTEGEGGGTGGRDHAPGGTK